MIEDLSHPSGLSLSLKAMPLIFPKILQVKQGKYRPFPRLLMSCLQICGEIQPCKISHEGGQIQHPVHSVLPEIRIKGAGKQGVLSVL